MFANEVASRPGRATLAEVAEMVAMNATIVAVNERILNYSELVPDGNC